MTHMWKEILSDKLRTYSTMNIYLVTYFLANQWGKNKGYTEIIKKKSYPSEKHQGKVPRVLPSF